jgi:alpha-mannosidase
VPALRASFPLSILNGRANFEIACGIIERPADGEESPALNWADLTGDSLSEPEAVAGATLLNDCKYGHQLSEDTLRLTLLRSSYDPDPLPEIGRHNIRFALVPHVGDFDPAAAVRQGHAFNHPVIPVGATVHEGDLPPEAAGLEVQTRNVMVSGVKRAEDSDALIVRLYELRGVETKAEVRISALLAAAGASAVETDLLEQPRPQSTAAFANGLLTVTVPAYGLATVRIG